MSELKIDFASEDDVHVCMITGSSGHQNILYGHEDEATIELIESLRTQLEASQNENARLREGMKGDYDLDAWLLWCFESDTVREQLAASEARVAELEKPRPASGELVEELRGAINQAEHQIEQTTAMGYELFSEGWGLPLLRKCLAVLTQPCQADGEWKREVIEKLIVDCIYTKDHENNPRKAINDLLSYEVSLSVDPRVSKEADDLLNSSPPGKVSVSQDVLEIAKGALQYKRDQREKEGLRATPITLKALEEIDKALQGGDQ